MFLGGSWHDDSSCWTDNTTSAQTAPNYLQLREKPEKISN